MPRWNSMLQMLCQTGRVRLVEWDDWPVLDLVGAYASNSGKAATDHSTSKASRMSTQMRWKGQAMKLHRVVYFNWFDDRHLFNYKEWRAQVDSAQRMVRNYQEAIRASNAQAKRLQRVRPLPDPVNGWRARVPPLAYERGGDSLIDMEHIRAREEFWVKNKAYIIQRPIWLCVSQPELDLLTPRKAHMPAPDRMRIYLKPVLDAPSAKHQPFANDDWNIGTRYMSSLHIAPRYMVKSIRGVRGEPDVENIRRFNDSFPAGTYQSLTRWANPVHMEFPEVVGPARMHMIGRFLDGWPADEVIQFMRSEWGEHSARHGWVYMDHPVSPDWAKHEESIRKELYG